MPGKKNIITIECKEDNTNKSKIQERLRKKLTAKHDARLLELQQHTEIISESVTKNSRSLNRNLSEIQQEQNESDVEFTIVKRIESKIRLAEQESQLINAKHLLTELLQTMSGISFKMKAEIKIHFLRMILECSSNIYLKFYKQTKNTNEAIKIIIDYADFSQKFFSQTEVASYSVMNQIFFISAELIGKYVKISSENDGEICKEHGDINDFLTLYFYLYELAKFFQLYCEKQALVLKQNNNQTEEDKYIINLAKNKLTCLNYYTYQQRLSSALLNYVTNKIHAANYQNLTSQVSEELNQYLAKSLMLIESLPLRKIIEFNHNNTVINYLYYGNLTKIYSRFFIITFIEYRYSIIESMKKNNFFPLEYVDNDLKVIGNRNYIAMEKIISNYELFIKNSKKYIEKFNEIPVFLLPQINNQSVSAELDVSALKKDIDRCIAGFSSYIVKCISIEQKFDLAELMQKFVPVLLGHLDYGSVELVNNIIQVNFIIMECYIADDESTKAKKSYQNALFLFRSYKKFYPDYFQKFGADLTAKFNYYLSILYDEIVIPSVTNGELNLEHDKEIALQKYKKVFNQLANNSPLKSEIIETINGTAFRFEIIDSVNSISAFIFIENLAVYLKKFLVPESVKYTEHDLIILGYSMQSADEVLGKIDQLKSAFEKIRIKQDEIKKLESPAALTANKITRFVDEASAKFIAPKKEAYRLRKQQRMQRIFSDFLKRQEKQQEIAAVKKEMRQQQQQFFSTITLPAVSPASNLQELIPPNTALSVHEKAVETPTKKVSASSSTLKKGFFDKPDKRHLTTSGEFRVAEKTILPARVLEPTLHHLLSNIQLSIKQLECLHTPLSVDRKIEHANLAAYTRQIFLSLMLWDDYRRYRNLQPSNGKWEEYRHRIVHEKWDLQLLRQITQIVIARLPSSLGLEKMQNHFISLKLDITEIMGKVDRYKSQSTIVEYIEHIKNKLNDLQNMLMQFGITAGEKELLKKAYQLWNERFLRGEALNEDGQYQMQQFTTLLEIFVEIGEGYARLKKLTQSAAYQKFSFNEELVEFLRDCKNIYRNELCHNPLFKFELTETNYALNSCQISWEDLIEHCCEGLQLIKVLNSNSDYAPVSDSSLSLSFV